MASIYTASGLRAIAQLLDTQIEEDQSFSQRQLSVLAGISGTTIKSIRGNRNITEAQIERNEHYEPGLLSLLAIAPHLIDPHTGQPFDASGQPSRFEKIARGWEELHPVAPKKPSKSELRAIPNAKAVAMLLQTAQRDPQRFEEHELPIDGEEFRSLAAGNFPSMSVISRLLRVLDLEIEDLAELYGLSPDEPFQPKDDKEKNGVH